MQGKSLPCFCGRRYGRSYLFDTLLERVDKNAKCRHVITTISTGSAAELVPLKEWFDSTVRLLWLIPELQFPNVSFEQVSYVHRSDSLSA